jgi:hypothetical protein
VARTGSADLAARRRRELGVRAQGGPAGRRAAGPVRGRAAAGERRPPR